MSNTDEERVKMVYPNASWWWDGISGTYYIENRKTGKSISDPSETRDDAWASAADRIDNDKKKHS